MVCWIRRFILFHGKHHPAGMGSLEIEAFLTGLAVQGKVSASTQNPALSALPFCLPCQRDRAPRFAPPFELRGALLKPHPVY